MWQFAAKYIGKKVAVKGIKWLISNSEGKKKSKEQLELEQEIEGLRGRSTFMTILMYASGILFSYYIFITLCHGGNGDLYSYSLDI